jgi:multiple sugar transport system permease protein
MFLMLSAQMFPFAMMLISLYPMLQWAGLFNTHAGLIIAYIILALPSGTYMLYSYFVNIPTEIIEAARADGAGELFILHRIVLPLAMPALVTVGLYSFMWAWNDLLFSLTLVTKPELRTVGPGLLLNYIGESRATGAVRWRHPS